MKKTLVTGEQGFIGSRAIQSVKGCVPSECDVLNLAEMTARLETVKPDFILHLAGLPVATQEGSDPAEHVNVRGTQVLLEAMSRTKSSARFLFASSAQVYKAGVSGKITEKHPIEPINFYAKTKRLAEEVIQKSGVKATVFRFFNHVHHSQTNPTFLGSLYQQMKAGKEIKVGNLDLSRDIGSIDDLILAIQASIEHSEKLGDFNVFNVCNGVPRRLRALAELLAKELNVKCQFAVDPTRFRPNEPEIVVGSYEKLHSAIGWEPQVKADLELIRAFLK